MKTQKTIVTIVSICTLFIIVALLYSFQYFAKNKHNLIRAVSTDNLSRVKQIIANGADVNLKDKYGQNALHYACYDADSNMIKFLLESGVDFNARDLNGHFPLEIAAKENRWDTLQILLDYGADIQGLRGVKILSYAVAKGKVKLCSQLIEKGVSVNTANSEGWAPLHIALRSYFLYDEPTIRKRIVKVLIEHGANVNSKNIRIKKDHSDSHVGNRPIVFGEPPNIGTTPLEIAISNGYEDIVDLLKQHGVESGGLE